MDRLPPDVWDAILEFVSPTSLASLLSASDWIRHIASAKAINRAITKINVPIWPIDIDSLSREERIELLIEHCANCTRLADAIKATRGTLGLTIALEQRYFSEVFEQTFVSRRRVSDVHFSSNGRYIIVGYLNSQGIQTEIEVSEITNAGSRVVRRFVGGEDGAGEMFVCSHRRRKPVPFRFGDDREYGVRFIAVRMNKLWRLFDLMTLGFISIDDDQRAVYTNGLRPASTLSSDCFSDAPKAVPTGADELKVNETDAFAADGAPESVGHVDRFFHFRDERRYLIVWPSRRRRHKADMLLAFIIDVAVFPPKLLLRKPIGDKVYIDGSWLVERYNETIVWDLRRDPPVPLNITNCIMAHDPSAVPNSQKMLVRFYGPQRRLVYYNNITSDTHPGWLINADTLQDGVAETLTLPARVTRSSTQLLALRHTILDIRKWPAQFIDVGENVEIAAISDDGAFVVTWDATLTYSLWVLTESCLERIPGFKIHAALDQPRARFSPDNKTLVLAARNGCSFIRINRDKSLTSLPTFASWHEEELPSTGDTSFEFSADGRILVVMSPYPAVMAVLKFVERPSFRVLRMEPPSFADNVMQYQCLMPGAIALGSADVDGTFKSWLLSPAWRYIALQGREVMLSLDRRFLADISPVGVRFYDLDRDWVSQTFRTELWIKGLGRITGISYPDRGFIADGDFEPDSGE